MKNIHRRVASALNVLLCALLITTACKKDTEPTPPANEKCQEFANLGLLIDDFQIHYQSVTGQPIGSLKFAASRSVNATNMTSDFYCFIKQQYKKAPDLFVKGKNETTHGDQIVTRLYSEDAKIKYEMIYSFPDANGSCVFKIFGYDKGDDGNWYRNDKYYTLIPFDK